MFEISNLINFIQYITLYVTFRNYLGKPKMACDICIEREFCTGYK